MSGDYALLTDVNKLSKLADQLLAEGKPIGFDVETGYSGPNIKRGSVNHWLPRQFTVGFSLTNSPDWARYIPLRHDEGPNVDSEIDAWNAVREMLIKGNIVAHNAKFEKHSVYKAAGINLAAEGKLQDTMLDAYVLSRWGKGMRALLDLKGLVLELFGHTMTHLSDLQPDLPDNQMQFFRFNVLELTPQVVSYACEDAAWVLALSNLISGMAKTERPVMQALEHRIMEIMTDVERYGVCIDWTSLNAAAVEGQTFLPTLEAAVKKGLSDLVNMDMSALNLNSPPQMKKLLYHDIGFQTTRQTASAEKHPELEDWQKMSTDAKALKALADDNPAVKKLLEFREVKVLAKKLTKWDAEFHEAEDGRIHANYKQAGAEDTNAAAPGTGRFSASDPPIQGVQKEWRYVTELGVDPFKDKARWSKIVKTGTNGTDYWTGNFRDFIVAAPGYYLLTYDYSQIELRVLAGESQEPALLKAFADGTDIHTVTAAMMLGKAIEDVDPKLDRPIGKTMNFALLYGMGPKSLSEQLGVSMDKASELYAQYFSAFTNVASWMEKVKEEGVKKGYAETRFGRRYTVWELTSPKPGIKAKGKRVLVNAPIQGAAADYMKMAMVRAHSELVSRGWWGTKCTIVMNQHDSLTFEVSNDIDPNELRPILEKCVVFGPKEIKLTTGFPKIVADWELGQQWGSSTKWEAGESPTFDGKQWSLPKKISEKEAEDELPEVAEETIQAALTADTRTYSEVRPLVVTTEAMPTQEKWKDFLGFVEENPGEVPVQFVCPEGELVLKTTTSLTPRAAGKISLLLGGATTKLGA